MHRPWLGLAVLLAGVTIARADVDPPSTPPDPVAVEPPLAEPEAATAPLDEATITAPAPGPAQKVELAVNRLWTGVFIVAGGLAWAGSDRVFQDTLAPKDCRIFCESEVNPFDREVGRWLTWDDDALPQLLSDGAAYVAIPVVAFGGLTLAAFTERARANWVDDALIVGEATVVVGVVNRIVALSFGRTRPRTRYAPADSPLRDSRQAHESFFSGHTSAAFSVGMSAAMVASMRGYKVAPYLWGSAITFGALTGYFRLAGADHWPTDVLVGAAVATTLSIVVPRLHRRTGPRLEPLAIDAGGGLALRGTW